MRTPFDFHEGEQAPRSTFVGTPLLTYQGHKDTVSTVAWSLQRALLASSSWNKTVQVWKPGSGECLLQKKHLQEIHALAWSPNGMLVASGGTDKAVEIWAASSGERLQVYHGHTQAVLAVSWSQDGTFIASGSDDCTGKNGNQTLHIWDARIGETLCVYSGHEERVEIRSVAWSPDGTRIASGGGDETVRIWSAFNPLREG